ncbi:putative RNA-binding protein [Leptomonas pyrrhocoris]|uniref:Putative RNA-binding protein n=1 Tax=Leptomonas pyrrhocoris TaxID=157538 RepID=A0A0N0DYC4_LEPPY|nr:putative RNA-binding protein [Leptomonas pyrrhocoris]KPA83988.1 putative RNA-binding protein [Leptomonas pyrrhocoris]|eukprot:XP_015662427.1 putative RNA-binding protein [Leptomonas pyrrhocoris]
MSATTARSDTSTPVRTNTAASQLWETGESSLLCAADGAEQLDDCGDAPNCLQQNFPNKCELFSTESLPLGLRSETESGSFPFDLTATWTSNRTLSILSATSAQVRTSTSVPNASVSEMSAPLQSPCVATADAEEDSHKHEEIIQRNVYISGLPSYMQSGEFRELCQRFGRVEASKLCVEGPSNPTKGYGFVLYYSEESATACIKGLSGSYLNGRCLQARLADTHATPHESKRRMQPRPPSPPPPPFAPPEHNAAERHRLMPHKVPSSGGNNDKMTLFNDDVSPKVVLPPPPPLPVQIVHPANAFLMNANSSATSAGTPTAAFSMAAQLIPGVGLADPSHATMQGMYYTCAPPLQAYQISPMSGGAEGQVVMLQPQPTIVYMAPSPYFTAAAATARTSRCAALPNSSFGQGTPTLPPLMLSSTPPAGVQIISLPSAPSALPM